MARFVYHLYDLSAEAADYEALHQRMLDEPQLFSRVVEKDHWTREGEHLIAVTYVIADDD